MQFPADIAADSGYVPMPRLFAWAMKDDAGAIALCLSVFAWSNQYDHIADRDLTSREAEEGALHDAMWRIAVEVPQNPFFQAHAAELSVSLANAVISWRTATRLQRDGDAHAARVAYVLRWVPIEFFLHCARLVGGDDWALQIAPQFWRIMTRDHSFEEFVAECGGK